MTVVISEADFGYVINNSNKEIVRCITLRNDRIKLQVLNFGATILSLQVSNLRKFDDIVLGYDDIKSYSDDTYYLGCTVGRFANRIAKGKFILGDKEYSLALNNGPNHLHGGIKGFNKVLWNYIIDTNKVTFFYTSPSMEENYPGELKCSVTYELVNESELVICYKATTTERTPINFTNHSYFNLGGHDYGTICDHLISINADYYTPVDEHSIPTGILQSVTCTPFDLREPKLVSSILSELPNGVDHNFCINGDQNTERKVARYYLRTPIFPWRIQMIMNYLRTKIFPLWILVIILEHPSSGRIMEIYSTQPGVQFYTANFLPEDNSLKGKNGKYYKKHGALCLETQNYPDAINQANFPKAFLDVGEEYKHTTRYLFSVK